MDRDDRMFMADTLYGECGEEHDWDDDCYDPDYDDEEYYENEEDDVYAERRKLEQCIAELLPYELKYFFDNKKETDIIFDSIEIFENYFTEHCKSVITKKENTENFKIKMLLDKYINDTINIKANEYHLQGFEEYYTKIKDRIKEELRVNKILYQLSEIVELEEDELCQYSFDPENAKKVIEVEKSIFVKLKEKWKVYYGEDYAERMLGKKQDADFNDCINMCRVIINLDEIRRGYFGATNFETSF